MASHAEVARRWAERSGPVGRAKRDLAGHHVWMDGDSIYSYGRHYTIARWTTMPNGERVAFFNATHSSVSTQKQKGIVRAAFRCWGRNCQSFTIPGVWLPSDALPWYQAQADAEFARASRARVYKDTDRAETFLAERDRLAALLTQWGIAA